MARTIALLDACVLYSAPARDLLLTLAHRKFYAAQWTAQIQDEWIHSFLRKNPTADPTALQRTRLQMDAFFPASLVAGHESLIETLTLPDPNDRHVLAAAITGDARVIVTFNLNDFPEVALSHAHIKTRHPDIFILNQMESDPETALACAESILKKLTRPPYTPAQYLESLKRAQLPKVAAFLNYHGFLGR